MAKSTFADANEHRDYRIFQDVALAMIATARIALPVDGELAALEADIYALDSTTIDLCLKLFPWAVFRRRKAAVKAHVLFDISTGIPVFMRVSHGKTHDLWMLDQIVPIAGAFYVMDRGYVDFARLYRLHAAGAFFVTRSPNAGWTLACGNAGGGSAAGPGPLRSTDSASRSPVAEALSRHAAAGALLYRSGHRP